VTLRVLHEDLPAGALERGDRAVVEGGVGGRRHVEGDQAEDLVAVAAGFAARVIAGTADEREGHCGGGREARDHTAAPARAAQYCSRVHDYSTPLSIVRGARVALGDRC